MTKRFLFVALCLAVCSTAGFAQTDRGTITGTVADATGAVVPGVTVEAKNVATGITYQAGSTETGNFTLPQLPVGTYEMSAALPGFKRFVRPGVVIGVAQVVRVDITLDVGGAGEEVTVEAAAPLLKTESGEVSQNFTSDALSNLPVLTLGAGAGTLGNIRNPLQAITLLPGASFTNENTLRINGMPSSSQSIRIDGQDATNGLWRQQNQGVQPGMEAIQEMSIQTSNYDAEYGQAGGGYFNYTMRSGTNDFHGTVYDYFVNEFLNAGTPFTDRATIGDTGRAGEHIRNRQRRNDWGFNVGGPIALGKLYDGHNRSFFFFNFEQFRETQFISTGLATVPTSKMRNGDFSEVLGPPLTIQGVPAVDPLGRPVRQNAIYNPATTRVAPDGSRIRDPYDNNIIPTDQFDPVARRIQDMIPLPTNGQLINNYTIPGYSNFRHTTIPGFKIDHNFNDNNKLSFYFSDTRTRSPNANGFTQPFTSASPTESDTYTYRLNYDRTMSPTLLLHLGAGFLYQNVPNVPPEFDQDSLGWAKSFYADIFPSITGLSNTTFGGTSITLGAGFPYKYAKEYKPTGNASLTWVRGNHSFKFGGELMIEGLPTLNYTRANGILGFGPQQSGIGSWEDGRGLNSTTGFPYSSFLLGRTNSLTLSAVTNTRLGNHSLAFYAQDSWKITRKLTFGYGLRYDYVTLLREQYGRMQSAAFDQPNPVAGNRMGTVIYEATCGCQFNKTYPWAFGPRLSLAYQVTPKTVLRLGGGVAYGSAPNNAFLSLSIADFYTYNPVGYGEATSQLIDGNPYAEGNRFGNPTISWPDFTPHYPSELSPGNRPPQSPFISIDRHAGRPPRIFQWSIGLQRELTQNLMVDVSYVGNRGAWWTAPLLAQQNYNALTIDGLKAVGIDINNPTDRALLTTPISDPRVIARFPQLANPNNVYPGFPASQFLNQALRPFPQWNGIPPFLGPPLGNTWYDSLQTRLVQRLARNLSAQVSYTWQKELTNGANSDTSYLTPNPPLINDVFDRDSTKQISSFSRPHVLVVTFNYTTPGLRSPSGGGMKVLSALARDWTFGGALRYQSGEVIRTPPSNNGLLTQLARGPANNPALWGGGNTFYNRVPGQPLFLKDPNCHCIDPTQDLPLNPAAWQDVPAGQFGVSAPYYNDYRWQRQPSESLSLGRNFRLVGENKVTLNVRAEFQNVFNRLFLARPSVGGMFNVNPATPVNRNTLNQLTGGYGYVNWFNGGVTAMDPNNGARPRSGQIVMRLIF